MNHSQLGWTNKPLSTKSILYDKSNCISTLIGSSVMEDRRLDEVTINSMLLHVAQVRYSDKS